MRRRLPVVVVATTSALALGVAVLASTRDGDQQLVLPNTAADELPARSEAHEGDSPSTEEVAEGTPVSPESLTKEATFRSSDGGARDVYSGRSADGETCLVVRSDGSAHDGAHLCGKDFFVDAPVAILETFALDSAGVPTSYEVIALMKNENLDLRFVDSNGQSRLVDVSGRVGFASLSDAELRRGVRPSALEAREPSDARFMRVTLRAAR
ncbi:MAG: hypothetical protein OEW52_12885 [Thermoleophilia bacterium]|nr:hypothetical protein [Thermoleophilia bacterium]MDH5282018.1 hypothetical protein [Thermoleophilia bacterium]